MVLQFYDMFSWFWHNLSDIFRKRSWCNVNGELFYHLFLSLSQLFSGMWHFLTIMYYLWIFSTDLFVQISPWLIFRGQLFAEDFFSADLLAANFLWQISRWPIFRGQLFTADFFSADFLRPNFFVAVLSVANFSRPTFRGGFFFSRWSGAQPLIYFQSSILHSQMKWCPTTHLFSIFHFQQPDEVVPNPIDMYTISQEQF